MFKKEDLSIICCPKCKSDLQLLTDSMLKCIYCNLEYPIIDGIPRLLYFGEDKVTYNKMWDYKWYVIDGGKGYTYEQLDENSAGYKIHNVFRYNEYENEAFIHLGDEKSTAVDIGCGIGQYTVKLLEKGAKRVFAIDLTRGVDIAKKILEERMPHLLDNIVFLQANARYLPIKTESADLSMALGSIHLSGYLEECIEEMVRITQKNKRFIVWIYSKPIVPLSDDKHNIKGLVELLYFSLRLLANEFTYIVTKRIPNKLLVFILKIFASDAVYFLRNLPVIGKIFKFLTIPGIPNHPDKGYRLINLYDTYAPSFTEFSDELDVIRWSKKFNFRILSFSEWRLGFLGEK